MGINENLGDILVQFEKSPEFKEVWEGFVKTDVIDSSYSFKQICSHFFGFGVIDAMKNQIKEENK